MARNTKGYVKGSPKGGSGGSVRVVREPSTTGYVKGVKGGKRGTVRKVGTPAPVTDTSAAPGQQFPTSSPASSPATTTSAPRKRAPGRSRQQSRILRDIEKRAQTRSRTPKPPKAYKAPKQAKASVPKPASPQPVKVAKQTAPPKTPKPAVRKQSAATAVMSSVPGKGPKVTQQKRKAARKELRQAKKAVRRSRTATRLPGLDTPEQQKVARTVLNTGKKMGATRKELLAAAQTGIVESGGFKNLSYGDADSEGWRQERRMYYPDPTNVKASAKRFFEESIGDTGGSRGKGMTAGQLAQTIQASAYPERYDEVKPEANAIVKAWERGKADPKAVKELKAAKKEAKELGLKVSGPGKAPKKVVTRYKAIDKAAKALEKAEVPYVYGGGHEVGTPKNPKAGLDCSSSTVWVLNKAGVKIPNIVSGEFGNHLPAGPGAVTVFYNPSHVFMRIGDRYYGTSRSNPNSGPGFIDTPSDEYLSQYNVAHVPGLGKKQALQLGIKPGDFSSAPGITFSEGGSTATVDPGAAVEQGKPGFSDKPIKLTRQQKVNRTNRKLRNLGVGVSTTGTSQPSTSTLDELEKKYGLAA